MDLDEEGERSKEEKGAEEEDVNEEDVKEEHSNSPCGILAAVKKFRQSLNGGGR